MAFDQKEQQIIQYGLQNGKSQQEVSSAISNYRAGVTPTKAAQPTPTPNQPVASQGTAKKPLQQGLELLGGPLKSSVDQVGSGFKDVGESIGNVISGKSSDQNTEHALGGGLKVTSGGLGVAFAPVITLLNAIAHVPVPGTKENIGDHLNKPITWAGDKVGDIKGLQKFVTDHPDAVEGIPNLLNSLAGLIGLKGEEALSQGGSESGGGKTTVQDFENKLHQQNADTLQQIENSKLLDVGDKTLSGEQLRAIDAEEKGIDNYRAQAPTQGAANPNMTPEALNGASKAGATNGGSTIGDHLLGYVKNFKEKFAPDQTLSGNVINDVLPSSERFVNTEVTKALSLTQGDVKNINLSTGNEVGQFLADNNLIGNNLDDTVKNIKGFGDTNYKQVRTEIGNIKAKYPANTVPRYAEALREIKKQTQDVAGLQDVNKEIDSLIKKKTVELSDIQRVKELMDKHFSLYKVVGDVKEGVAKQGLAKIRSDIQKFIEQQVKLKTQGRVDIGQMNNNVSTARSLEDAIETRSTRGLTNATITPSDILTFLTGSTAGGPVTGVLAVIGKKIYQSPSFKLKVSKWLDGLNDAGKAKVAAELGKGVLPQNFPKSP